MVYEIHLVSLNHFFIDVCMFLCASVLTTVPLDLNFTYARAQKATARNIHGNAPE